MVQASSPIRVMVVDDDEATVAFVRRHLSAEPGIAVPWAARVDEAVALAQTERPSVVVIDGGWRGRPLVEQLRTELPRTKVLSVNGLQAAAQISKAAPSAVEPVAPTSPARRLVAAVRRLYSDDGPTTLTLGLPPTAELVIHFQGIHDLQAGDAAVGFEALMRWGNQGQLVPPGSFLPLVEAEGRITDYDRHAVGAALTQLATWRQQRGVRAPEWVSVNLSGINLRRPDLPTWVAATVLSLELDPASLVLEFDYSDLAADLTTSARRLGELRAVGVRAAVDNVVAGPAEVRGVATLAVDMLKVGRGLTGEIGKSPAAMETMRALLQATSHRDWPCIATGIEDAAQLDELRSAGWRFAQGHLLSKPMTALGCEPLLAQAGSAPG